MKAKKSQPTFKLFKKVLQRVVDNNEDKKHQPVNETVNEDSLRHIMDRLTSFNKKHEYNDRDLRFFGMEDESGQVIKVAVKKADAAEFEVALQNELAELESSSDYDAPVAEILFKLKDQFEIVDVKWPKIEQDEEVDQRAVSPDLDTDVDSDQDELRLDFDDDDSDTDIDQDAPAPDNGSSEQLNQVTDLMNKFIEVMKAETSARQAEADARKREAQMREQELAIQQTVARIKQEEQILDMEADMKARKEQDQEVRTLAQLAQWRSETARDQGKVEDNEDIFPNLQKATKTPSTNKSEPTKKPTKLNKIPDHRMRAQRILGKHDAEISESAEEDLVKLEKEMSDLDVSMQRQVEPLKRRKDALARQIQQKRKQAEVESKHQATTTKQNQQIIQDMTSSSSSSSSSGIM